MSAHDKRYGLIGKSLGHSFSKQFFSEKFARETIDASYENFELERIEDFCTLDLDGLNGLNVTIPYKQEIMVYLDEIDPVAQRIGAVNTISIVNGRSIGHNTDAIGFRDSIRPFLKSYHTKALILGTGGASRAVSYVLEQMGIDFLFVSRTPQGPSEVGYDVLNEQAIRTFPFIINTTPLGTAPEINARPDIPYASLDEYNFLYDLVYNPPLTAFLKAGQEAGAQILNGRRMLELQAMASYTIWTSQR